MKNPISNDSFATLEYWLSSFESCINANKPAFIRRFISDGVGVNISLIAFCAYGVDVKYCINGWYETQQDIPFHRFIEWYNEINTIKLNDVVIGGGGVF